MTSHKHLKQLVRARMAKTGESYATARREIVRRAVAPLPDPLARGHLPGSVPATTALRILLAHAGVRAPHTGAPFSEAMLFGIAGGIGVGVFSFYYEREGVASFFLAGRHLWQDDLEYLRQAAARLGLADRTWETAGAKQADAQLAEALAGGPCIAWVDAAQLAHRAMPESWSGGTYHVLVVYALRDGQALVGDLTDEPIALPLDELRAARGRIRKFKHRLLALAPGGGQPDLAALVDGGLRACHDGLVRQRGTNFTLEALRVWAERLHGSAHRESWDRVFAPGRRLWRGLVSVYDFVEHFGTGGGLCRPIFADFLAEAADATGDARLRPLAERYAGLGRAWTDLARAALPDDVPALRRARELHDDKAELLAAGGPAHEIRAVWGELARLEAEADAAFPLGDRDAAALRESLQRRVRGLYEEEKAAHAAVGELLG